MKHWWQNQPLTISAVQCSLGDSDEYVLDEYVSKSSFTAEQLLHLVANGHMGYYNKDLHSEKLTAYLKKSRAHGVREIVYHNTHCISDALAAEHPDWLQLDKNGKRIPAYTIYNLVCVNPHSAFHKNFLNELAELCSHDVDGVFLDGPLMRNTGCYCDVCRRDFATRFGHPIEEATRTELAAFSVETVTQHLKEAHETVKRVNPEILLYCNNSALRGDVTGSNTRKVYDYVDMIGAEGGFYAAELIPTRFWQTSAFMKQLEGIVGDTEKGEKPIINFFAGNLSGVAYYMHTPAETLLTYAQTYSNGGNVWYGVHFSASEFKDTPAAKTAAQMNRFVLKHKDLYAPSKTAARVALMWSQNTANNYASSLNDSDFVAAHRAGFPNRGDHFVAFCAALDMLERNHIQFDVIDEVSVTNGTVRNYDSVILPEVACLSDDCARALADYVAAGGNLLGNFDIGTYNEDGSFAGTSKLAKVFGFAGDPKKVHASEIGQCFLFCEGDTGLCDKLSFPRIPSPTLNMEWEFADDVKILMQNSVPMPSRYADLPDERYAGVTVHNYGKGKAYYACGNFGETAVFTRNVIDYKRLLRAFCDATSRPVTVSDGEGLCEVVLRRQGKRFLLHVINLTGAMERSIEKIVPLRDVPFSLDLSGFGVEERNFVLSSVRDAKVKNASQDGMKLSFTLDQVGAYEIIVIE